jgi:endonuclease YncB( thermonuclease family)
MIVAAPTFRALAFFCVALLLAGCVTVDAGGDDKPRPSGPATGADSFMVQRVISGDLIELETGETIRYVGVRAPGKGEDFHQEARLANERLVFGKLVRVKVVFLKGIRDEKGRRLAHVYTPGSALNVMTWVNAELLEGGWGRLDYKGLASRFERRFEEREAIARTMVRGIWKTRG